MEKVLQVFNSFAEAEEADRKYYRSLTPAQRIEILLILRSLIKRNDDEPRGRLKRVYRIINALKVRYIIVGAFAVAYHGYPRYTGDIDLFIERSSENAHAILNAIRQFGFGDLGLSAEDFLQEDQVIQLGIAPNRIDLLTFLSGVEFQEAWDTRVQGEIAGLRVPFISKELLKKNKTASGRSQDKADLEHL
jgi:hypothetical protein